MKVLIAILSVSLLLGTHAIAAEKVIVDNEASKYVGESVAVKGIIANVFQSNKGNIFLNFGSPYPNQTFYAVIFGKDAAEFGNVKAYEGKTVIVTGVVQSYKGKAEIILLNATASEILSETTEAVLNALDLSVTLPDIINVLENVACISLNRRWGQCAVLD